MNWLQRAKKVIPTGSQTYSKSHYYFTKPFFATQGLGGILVSDEEVGTGQNREYHDFSMGLGSVILGYKSKQWWLDLDFPNGVNFSCPHLLEVKFAEKLLGLFPHHDMVKFFKNGSDATEIAVRLARAYTGRDLAIVGSYHGFHDWYVASTDRNRGIPLDNQMLVSQFNGIEEFKNLMDDDIACVIVEPTIKNVKEISQLTKDYGALLIFDEVMTGFRYDVSGLQRLLDIEPDITCLGKCMANGLPLSAVLGKREVMQLMDDGNVFASSTFGGETLSLAAALKTIETLEKEGAILWGIGARWWNGMEKLIKDKGLEDIMKLEGYAPRCGVTFENVEYQSLYQQELLKRRVLTHGINNYCLDHTNAQIDYFLEQADEVLDIIKKAKKQGSVNGLLEKTIQTMFRR